MVVKDFNGDDKILACIEHDGKYRWKMFNGIEMIYKMFQF